MENSNPISRQVKTEPVEEPPSNIRSEENHELRDHHSEWRVPNPPVHEIGSSDEEVDWFKQSPAGYPYGPSGEAESLGLRRSKRIWKWTDEQNNGQRVRYFPAKRKSTRPRVKSEGN